jgi:NAD-dependent SIR2 family protein deacetylase
MYVGCLLRAGNYQPTPTHHFIKLLHDKGLLLRCFTQNIDSLEHQVRMSAQQQHARSTYS